MKSKFTFVFLLFLGFFPYLRAQQIIYSDSTSNLAANHTVSRYSEAIKDQLNIYNGVSYNPYPYRLTKGSSYFPDEKWQNAVISYDGVLYKNVKCMYDLVQGQVVVLHKDNYSRIALHKGRIESVEFSGNRFERIQDIGGESFDLYQVLHEGSTHLLVKRSKIIEERTTMNGLERNVTAINSFFLKRDGKMSSINSKNDLFSLLKDKKVKIKQHLKEEGLKYQKNEEETIIAAVKYYDQVK